MAATPNPPASPPALPPALRWAPFGVLCFVLLVLLIFTAWVCDDAYITFRVVDNFVHGYGPRYNVAERVQAYTHPLWMFSLSAIYAFTREPFYTSIAFSAVLTFATIAVFATRIATSAFAAALGLLVLVFSRAFIDYSTSGLENPLTHLLIAVFVALAIPNSKRPRRLALLALVAAALALNRPDTVLLALPLVFWRARQLKLRASAGALLLGLSPLLAWIAFSVLYYGYPAPNTAYAKLHTALSRVYYLQHGVAYLWESFTHDPITLVTILAACVYGVLRPHRTATPLAIGAALYVIYVIWVGGDFMSGRLLTPPLLLGVLILTFRPAPLRLSLATCAAFLLLGLLNPGSPIRTLGDKPVWIEPETGAADERGYYYENLGLLPALRGLHSQTAGPASHPWAQDGMEIHKAGYKLVTAQTIGLMGYYAGPHTYIVDRFALCDPLLIYLPVTRERIPRIGHMGRLVPAGYYDSIRNDDNELKDSALAKLYDMIRLVTRGPLLSLDRLKAIVRLNLGLYPHVDESKYFLPKPGVTETPPTSSASSNNEAPAPPSPASKPVDEDTEP